MPVVGHIKWWWNWCVSEDKKKVIDPTFIEEFVGLCQ